MKIGAQRDQGHQASNKYNGTNNFQTALVVVSSPSILIPSSVREENIVTKNKQIWI